MEHFENGELSVFVSLVLEYFFNGHCFSSLRNSGLEHHTEGSVTNDFLSIVSHTLLLASSSVVYFVLLYEEIRISI